MGNLSKEQEQAIARSTMYLVAALLSILVIFIAGVFLFAELEHQALQKAETEQQIAGHQEVASPAQRPLTLWKRHADQETQGRSGNQQLIPLAFLAAPDSCSPFLAH